MTTKLSRRGFIGSAATGAVGASLLSARPARAASYDPVPLDNPMSLWDLPTPALVVDEDALDFNLDKMASFFRNKPARLRPHTKTHKCPILAKKQLDQGAHGVCAAKVSEAEVMVDAGVTNVLITSPVVTRDKIARVIALAKKSSDVAMVVDQEQNVRDFNAAAAAAGTTLQVVVGLNVMNRTGIAMGEPAVNLVKAIHDAPVLRFGGLQAYAGHLQHQSGFEYRKQASEQVMTRAVEMKETVEKEGYDVPVLTGGGTGTYNIDSEVDGVDEMQVGSYLFMDVNYRKIGGKEGAIFDDFRPSLMVLSTAISQPAEGRITIDAGLKSFATDNDLPQLRDIQGVSYRWGGDEHGILMFKSPSRRIEIGDKVLLIASHCDPTVNLYDHYYPYRNETVTELWPIAARGRSQ